MDRPTDRKYGGRGSDAGGISQTDVTQPIGHFAVALAAREPGWGGGERVAACRRGQRGVARGLADQKKEVETMPPPPALLTDGHDQHDQRREGGTEGEEIWRREAE